MGRATARMCNTMHIRILSLWKNSRIVKNCNAILPKNWLFERSVKGSQLESDLHPLGLKGASPVRTLGPLVLLILTFATNSFAAPAVAKATVVPETGLLVLLGGGLVGLASFVRRHLSE